MSFFVFNSTFPQQENTVIEDDYETLKDKIRFYFNASNDRSMMYAEQMTKSSNYEHLAFAIALWKKDDKIAEKIYYEVIDLGLKNKQLDLLSVAYYNLGGICHE